MRRDAESHFSQTCGVRRRLRLPLATGVSYPLGRQRIEQAEVLSPEGWEADGELLAELEGDLHAPKYLRIP